MNTEKPIAIREGRKIVRYEYRNIHIERNTEQGTRLFRIRIKWRNGEVVAFTYRTLAETVAAVDRTLAGGGRDWYAKPVEYKPKNGVMTYVDYKTGEPI